MWIELIPYILLLPFFSSLFVGIIYLLKLKKCPLSRIFTNLFALLTPLGSFLIAFGLFVTLESGFDPIVYELFQWVHIHEFDISFALLIDEISLFMVLFITFIGWLIHIYAVGYMSDDKGYEKFFFYFNLFLTSMLLLVLGSNPVIMFIGWEGVGFCSYLLISYYHEKNESVNAGNKAFMVNRVGDLGFIIGYTLLFFAIGAEGFDFISLEKNSVSLSYQSAMMIGFFLFVGAMAKSAQIPLYVWLPDAMAGPTPVSALIHAATMVTAGVYLVARFHFIYEIVVDIGLFIAYIGAFSSLFAAIIATKQNDIKKILAYSTMSQLGYMFVAVGLGAYSAGLFHVFTHAFFKALLFLGAGGIIVALHHEQDIHKMGGMRQDSPFLYIVMLVATLAICGIPPFAGFFSKDEILLKAFVSGEYMLWILGIVTAFLTAYYMFRMFFIVFDTYNPNRIEEVHALPQSMKIPLVVLALGSIGAGFIGVPAVLGGEYQIGNWLHIDRISHHISHSSEYLLMGVNILIASLGIFVAYKKFYAKQMQELEVSKEGLVFHKFYIDEIYDMLIVQNYFKLSQFIAQKVDMGIVDGILRGSTKTLMAIATTMSLLQNGNIRYYALYMLFGVSMTFVYLMMVLG